MVPLLAAAALVGFVAAAVGVYVLPFG